MSPSDSFSKGTVAQCSSRQRKHSSSASKKKDDEKVAEVASAFKKIWNQAKAESIKAVKSAHKIAQCNDRFAEIFMEKLFKRCRCISEYPVGLEDMTVQLKKRVQRTATDKLKRNRNRKLMTSIVTMLIDNNTENTLLVRDCLTTLYSISHFIDRELFLYEHHKENNLDDLPAYYRHRLLERRKTLLRHLSGWEVPNAAPWNTELTIKDKKLYLDLPYRRSHNQANTHLMAEALYREQDPEFALLLLRHGVPASFFYLWSICILIDMKYSMNKHLTEKMGTNIRQLSILHSDEAKVIRYFCRARHYINVHPLPTGDSRDWELEMRMFMNVSSYEDFLVCPTIALPLIPEDRYKTPSRLMHQCRLRLRSHLFKHGRIPEDIYSLPLPASIQRYVDLLED